MIRDELGKAAKRNMPGCQELGTQIHRNGPSSISRRVRMRRGNHDQRLFRLELQAKRFDMEPLRDKLVRDTFVNGPGVARIGKKPREAHPDALGVPSLAILPLSNGRPRANTSGTSLEDFTHRSYLASIRAGAATPLLGRVVDEDPAWQDEAPATIVATSSSVPSIAAPVEERQKDL